MLEAIFITGVDEIKVSGLCQWDRGQMLRITCPDLPSAFQVHYAKRKKKETIVVQAEGANNVATVAIPDVMLQEPFDLYAYLYFDEGLIGETAKIIRMPVRPRAKPDDYVIDLPQEQQTDAEKIIEKMMDEHVEAARAAALEAEQAAEQAAQETAAAVNDEMVGYVGAAQEAQRAAEQARDEAQNALLPGVTASDNGKFLRVVNGVWAAEKLTNVAEEGA